MTSCESGGSSWLVKNEASPRRRDLLSRRAGWRRFVVCFGALPRCDEARVLARRYDRVTGVKRRDDRDATSSRDATSRHETHDTRAPRTRALAPPSVSRSPPPPTSPRGRARPRRRRRWRRSCHCCGGNRRTDRSGSRRERSRTARRARRARPRCGRAVETYAWTMDTRQITAARETRTHTIRWFEARENNT